MDDSLSRLERVRGAIKGWPIDRPPFTVWYHFGLQHAPAERSAQAHLEFFTAYDLDWLKVMNDYSYPMPDGMETLTHPDDLKRLTPLDMEAGGRMPDGAYRPGEQLKVIAALAEALKGKALLVDTVFNAWNTLRRNVAKEHMEPLMRSHPERLEAALRMVNENLVAYARASIARGAAGIFLAVPASEESVTRDQFERFMRPFDLALLEAVADRGELNVVHAHGKHPFFDRVLDYPVHALSWGDRDGGPTLEEARHRTSLALMGGIAHVDFAYLSAAAVREQVRTAVADAAGHRFLLAPGCSLPTYAFPELIRTARDEVERTAPVGSHRKSAGSARSSPGK